MDTGKLSRASVVCMVSSICTHSTRFMPLGMAVQSVGDDIKARDTANGKAAAGSERI